MAVLATRDMATWPTQEMAAWQMPHGSRHATVALVMIMDSQKDKPTDPSRMERQRQLWPETLYNVETFFRENGISEFEYDEELDVFRFPEDGRFAFCREFANWDLLQERGYMVDF